MQSRFTGCGACQVERISGISEKYQTGARLELPLHSGTESSAFLWLIGIIEEGRASTAANDDDLLCMDRREGASFFLSALHNTRLA